jgi:hypothetical protein
LEEFFQPWFGRNLCPYAYPYYKGQISYKLVCGKFYTN